MNTIYTNEMQHFRESISLLTEDAKHSQTLLKEDRGYLFSNKILHYTDICFLPFFVVLENLYRLFRYKELPFNNKLFKPIKKQKQEFFLGLFLWIVVLSISLYSITIALLLIFLFFLLSVTPIFFIELMAKKFFKQYETLRNNREPFNNINGIANYKINRNEYCHLKFPYDYMKEHNLSSSNQKLVVFNHPLTTLALSQKLYLLNRVNSKYFLILPDSNFLLLLDFTSIPNECDLIINEIEHSINSLLAHDFHQKSTFDILDKIIEEKVSSILHSINLHSLLENQSKVEVVKSRKKL